MLLDDYRSSDGRSISITNLKIPCVDGDTDSIGFLDVEEVKQINLKFRRRTVGEVDPISTDEKPRGFAVIRAWLDRRKENKNNYCYSNPIDDYQPKLSTISSIPLPIAPPKKKRKTMARRLQIFLFCLPH